MRSRGKTGSAAFGWLMGLMLLAWPALAAPPLSQSVWPWPVYQGLAASSLEAQMLGEKPPLPASSSPLVAPLLPDQLPQFHLDAHGGVSLKLPRNLEMQISFRYNRDPAPLAPQTFNNTILMARYALDYRLSPNLRLGLQGYVFRPSQEIMGLPRQTMGFGSSLKYDLGRWSFLLKSQLESGSRDNTKDLQNWLRLWYAF